MRALIVDDESNCRENLQLLLTDFCENVEIVAMAGSTSEARALIAEHEIDILFLDVMMPGGDGFSLLDSLKDRNFHVVFTTAHDEFALKAIKVEAVDYLEKPINIEELIAAVEKVRSKLNKGGEKVQIADDQVERVLSKIVGGKGVEKTAIATKDGLVLVLVKNEEIVHLEAAESYTIIYLQNGKRYLSSKTIKVYEDNLNSHMFFRVHKSHIINVSHHLKEFNRTAGNVAVMSNDKEIPISRRKLTPFLERISTF